MLPHSRWSWHALRVLVLAIAMVFAPARSPNWGALGLESPALVLESVNPLVSSAPVEDADLEGVAFEVTVPCSSARGGSSSIVSPRLALEQPAARAASIRISSRAGYLMNCAWLC